MDESTRAGFERLLNAFKNDQAPDGPQGLADAAAVVDHYARRLDRFFDDVHAIAAAQQRRSPVTLGADDLHAISRGG